MAENNEVIGQMMFDKAQKEYPYLANKDISFAYTPTEGEQRMLEFYHPEETERPEYMPPGKVGIEVFNTQTKPLDILGDYVSHYAVNTDPKLQQLYSQFGNQLDPNMMQQRYQYHTQNFGETRPFELWMQMTGLPEMFRGYTFNQWENAKDMYTPQQLQTLDAVRSYLGIK